MTTATNPSQGAEALHVSAAVARLGALPEASLAMPPQVLEHAGGWRGMLAQLIAGAAGTQQQRGH